MFEYLCPRSAGTLYWQDFLSDCEVGSRILDRGVKYFEEALNENRLNMLRRFVHVNKMLTSMREILLVGNGWKNTRFDQLSTWRKSMRTLANGLSCVDGVRLAGLGPRGPF